MDLIKDFSIETIKTESKERGWLFSVVAGWCAFYGISCLLLAAAVCIKALFVKGVPTQPALGLTIAATIILGATAMMWKLKPMGRNVAIVTVACMSWVVGGYISSRTGNSMAPQFLTIVFAAMSMACFTSPRGRELFRKVEESDEGEAVL